MGSCRLAFQNGRVRYPDGRWWPEEVANASEPHMFIELATIQLDAEILQAWVERQKARLDVQGVSWTEWCDSNGISEWSRKRLKQGGLISYTLADAFLSPAGFMPEDLYGWP